MKIVIYPLIKTSRGKAHGEFETATVSLADGQTLVDCPDRTLRIRLERLFSTPLLGRRPLGEEHGAIAFEIVEVPPNTPEFFEEMFYVLRRHSLVGRWVR